MSYNHGPRIVTNGLVLHLDAGSAKSYPGSGTIWNDLSGNNNNGTLVNGPTYNIQNKGSIVFDRINDYMIINSFNAISEEFTISSFIYPILTTGGGEIALYGGTVFSQDPILSTSRYPLWLRVKNTELSYSIWDDSAAGQTTTGANISQNTWHYITVTAKKNGPIQIFKNNLLIVNSTCKNQGIWNGNFYIGDLRVNRGIYFGGRIALVTIYNRLLSQIEVLQNYNALKGRYVL